MAHMSLITSVMLINFSRGRFRHRDRVFRLAELIYLVSYLSQSRKVESTVTLRTVQEFKLGSLFDRHLRCLGVQKTLEKANDASFQTQLPELVALMIAGR